MKSLYILPFICTFFSISFNASSQVTLFTQGFNTAGTPSGWINTNLSTGGDLSIGGGGPDSAKWTLRQNSYHYTSVFMDKTFQSNDASQFYLSNSDAQGDDNPSPKTNTILQSPAINTVGFTSLSLKFFQNFWSASDADSALIEISTNGTTWTQVYLAHQANTFEIGTASSFVLQTINLDAYINLSTVYFRFHYLATWGYYWAIDNVTITGNGPNPCNINYWEGTISTAWENAANWSCGSIPNPNTIIYIEPGKPNYPVINSMATCKTIYLNTAATVTVSTGFNLDITGP